MLLLIDTSQEAGYAALAGDGKILFSEENMIAREHGSWLHVAIGRILDKAGKSVRDLEGVAVVAGPGSYTGLRVGLAAAKGFCYALKIPLFTQNTLDVMAESMRATALAKNALICPMIDARRDEVYTALYRPSTTAIQILPPEAKILDKNAFETELSAGNIIFSGSGALKWSKMTDSPNAVFEPQSGILQAFASLAHQDFLLKREADPVYSEPVYLKEFFSY